MVRSSALFGGRNGSPRALWAVLTLSVLFACRESTTEVDPPSNDPAQVEILEGDARVLIGNEIQFTAQVRTALGTALPTITPQWTSSNSAVASVDDQGLVRANSPGEAMVFATAGSGLDSVNLTVPVSSGFAPNEGIVIQSADGEVQLDIPANSVPEPSIITIIAAQASDLPTPAQEITGTAFEFGPDGLTFATPATLTIKYDRANTDPLEARRLRLHKLFPTGWQLVGSAVDTANAEVSGPISGFSIYAIVAVPNAAPTAAISAPTAGTVTSSGLTLDFAGTGSDDEDGPLTGASLSWSSSIDGDLGTGETLSRSDLSLGDHVVTLTATDSEGSTATADVSITVVDGPPVVLISAPSLDTVMKLGDPVQFAGSATDFVEGAIPADSLTWTSSIDGALGMGDTLTATNLSLGDHVVTLSARDSQGQEGTASVTVSVKANEPPTVTIVSPNAGASVPDMSGTTFVGSAVDPEDGTLAGTSLSWTSSLDGALGVGASLPRGGLTIGAHVVTLVATDSDGATASATVAFSVYDEPPLLYFPQLSFVSEAAGALTFSVTNSASYSNELFTTSAAYPACAGVPVPSRTWLEVFDSNGTFLTRFCDFTDRSDLASFTFTPASPPARVYIELWDHVTNRRVRSGSVTPVPSVPTSIHGVVVNDRDADLNTNDPGEALSGVTMQLIVDANTNGVIDAGETTFASTTTNGSGAYSFTGLWQSNYIVRAVSPSNATVLRSLSGTGAVVDQTGTLVTTAVVGAGATLNQSGTSQVGNTDPSAQGDEFPRWGYTLGSAAPDTGLEPTGPGPNSMNGALTTAPAHFTFLFKTGGLSGTVKTGGVGVAGVRVIVTRCQTAPSAPSPPSAGACTQKHGVPSPHIRNIDTDANGNYSATGLLEGVYQIEVAPQTAGYTNVIVPAGPSTWLATLRGDGDNAAIPDFSIN